jgi:predicted DNA-binding protein (UPF0251 family)
MKKLPEHEIQQTKAFRLTKEEYIQVNKLAAYMGISFSEFLRMAMRNQYKASVKLIKRKQIGLFSNNGYDFDINEIIG